MDDVTRHSKPIVCPFCKAKLVESAPVFERGAVPDPGSVTLCTDCCTILRFQDDMTLKMLTQDDINEIHLIAPSALTQIFAAFTALKMTKENRASRN